MRTLLGAVVAGLSVLLSGASATAHCDPGEVVIKFSHVVNADTPKGIAAAFLAQRVNEEMDGKACMQVFPNSTLFGDNKVLEALLQGDVQLAAPSLSRFEKFTKVLEVYDLPFLFADMQAVDKFQDSKVGQDMLKSMENKGFLGLAYWHNGMKQLSANKPLLVPEDAKGVKFRVQSSDVLVSQFEAVGANPQKLAFSEVYQALQTGAVNGQENTWWNAYSQKYQEVQSDFTESNHGLIDYMVVTNAKWWNDLPPDIREGLTKALKEATEVNNQVADQLNKDARARIAASKARIHELTPEQRKKWQEAMKPVWKKFEQAIGSDLIAIASAQSATHDLKAWPTVDEKPFATVRVYYATDRNRTRNRRHAVYFGSDRGETTYGFCDVSIPRDHRMGEIEAPSILRLEFRQNPEKHVVLLSVSVQQPSSFFKAVSQEVGASDEKKALVFIHGYNVSFEDAAKRTAQIAYDLGFMGAPIFYSWPSQGTFGGYVVDETNAQWSMVHLTQFLKDIVKHTSAKNIYLVAHSMGNRLLLKALSDLTNDSPSIRKRFKEVILAAPDIDAEIFKRDIAPQIITPSPSVTLYVSNSDRALLASKQFHGYLRIGDASEGIPIVPGIETIDVSGVESGFLGHSYYGDIYSVLADIFYLIRYGARPNNRFALEPVPNNEPRYWRIKRH